MLLRGREGLDSQEIVRRAKVSAVAVDRRGRILAWNRLFADLAGSGLARGKTLHRVLGLRDVFGNRLGRPQPAVWEMLVRGEPLRRFRLQLTQAGGGTCQAEVSAIVVLNGGRAYELVYLFEPVRRRRRADEAIERLLDEPRRALEVSAAREVARRPAPLTARQLEVLRHLAEGRTTRELAQLLQVSHRTARTHVERILDRTGTHSQAEAVAWALRHYLL